MIIFIILIIKLPIFIICFEKYQYYLQNTDFVIFKIYQFYKKGYIGQIGTNTQPNYSLFGLHRVVGLIQVGDFRVIHIEIVELQRIVNFFGTPLKELDCE